LGLEPGDAFYCDHQTPGGFYLSHNGVPVIEELRFEGNLPYLGARAPNMMDFNYPDGEVAISGINMGCLYHV